MNDNSATVQREVPLLVQFPKHSKWNKENKFNNLKLIKLPLVRREHKETVTLTRLPLNNFHLNQMQPVQHLYNAETPKLINLKPVFQKQMINSKSHSSQKNVQRDVPQLIRLPKLQPHPNLLETPRKATKTTPREVQKAPKVPVLTDLRPLSPRPMTPLLVNPIEESKVPMGKKTFDKQPSSKIIVTPHNEYRRHYDSRSSSSSPRHHRKHRNREDELYDVISELLVKRKNRRKRRRLKLFDILDNIPVTSEDDSDIDDHQPRRRKKSKETVPNLGLVFLPEKQDNQIHTNGSSQSPSKNNLVGNHLSGIPNPPNNYQKPSSGITDDQLSRISKYFDPSNKENDPLSWMNIIKASRNETKETQTDKLSSHDVNNKEIQTELKEMIEIPKSVTFLSPPNSNLDVKTKEFCDRIRKEVISKITVDQTTERRLALTSFGVQTSPPFEPTKKAISSMKEAASQDAHLTLDPEIFQNIEYERYPAVTQTESKRFLDVIDVESSDRVNNKLPVVENIQDLKLKLLSTTNNEHSDKPRLSDGRLPSSQVEASSIVKSVHLQYQDEESSEKLSIDGDISTELTENIHKRRPPSPRMDTLPGIKSHDNILPTDTSDEVVQPDRRAESTQPESISIIDVHMQSNEGILPIRFTENDVISSEFYPSGEGSSTRKEVNTQSINEMSLKELAKNDGLSAESYQHKRYAEPIHLTERPEITVDTMKKRPIAFKTNIKGNLKEFATGLQALEDLQENLEKELKQSKLLFNTITTLQRGFAPDEEIQRQAETNYRANTSRYNVRNIQNSSDQTDERGNTENDVRTNLIGSSDSSGKLIVSSEANIKADESHASHLENVSETVIDDGLSMNIHTWTSLERSRDIAVFSPRSIIRHNTGALSARSMMTPRSMMNSSSVKFALDVEEEVESIDLETDMERSNRIEKENTLREQIRRRITNPVSEEEIQAKQESSKRSKLLNWMRERQQERLHKYKEEMQDKRAAEHRPFNSQCTVTKKQIDETIKERADLKRALLEETNIERLNVAERLAYDVMSKGKDVRQSPSKKFMNNRYTKRTPTSLVRETRASRMRKNALLRDVARHAARLSRVELKKKRKNRNVSLDGAMGRDTNVIRRRKSPKASHTSMVLLSDVLDDDVYFPEENITRPSRFSYKSPSDEPSRSHERASFTKSNQSSVDRSELRKILTEYGVKNDTDDHVDGKLFDRKASITELLAEVDLALLTDNSDVSTNSQTIDWNEIDNILNE